MKRLANKRILLGITGSIAAYKAGEIIRRLRDANADVRVVMTQGATEFVTPLTFQALSGNPVHQHLLDNDAEAAMGHIELARWADVILVAPASADFISRLCLGRANDLLGALCLASHVPLALAPAMNQQMWKDPATQTNVQTLHSRGVLLFGPDSGEQACGEVGEGRLMQPHALIDALADVFATGSLTGQTVLITAGPTREAIDPVRYLSNHSSGKMGYALATAAMEAGAEVILISGPVDKSLLVPHSVKTIHVTTAEQMLEQTQALAHKADILIAAAAVADYRPVLANSEKIKKSTESMMLQLQRNPDILATVKRQSPWLFSVGFAAETENLELHARQKLKDKGVEMIVANWVGHAATETQGTFGSDDNALKLFWDGGELELGVSSKARLARELVVLIASQYDNAIQSGRLNKEQREVENVVQLRSHSHDKKN